MGFLQSPSIFLEIAFDKLRDFSSQSGVRVLRYKGYAVKPHSAQLFQPYTCRGKAPVGQTEMKCIAIQ